MQAYISAMLSEMRRFFAYQNERMENILSPLGIRRGYSPLNDQDSLEACQIGKFLCSLGDDTPILQKGESPDFLVTFPNGLKVGIEHTRILTEHAEMIGLLRSLIDKAEKIFVAKYPQESRVFANISFRNDHLQFTKTDGLKFATIIADYVYYMLNNIVCELPDFLSRVNVNRLHDRVGFVLMEDKGKHISLPKDKLQESVSKKEGKLANYNHDQTISEHWLVVVIGSLSSASYELDDNIDYRVNSSSFDKIFLFCDFDAKIIQVK